MSVIAGQIALFLVDMKGQSYHINVHDSNFESVIAFVEDAFELFIDKSCTFVHADTAPKAIVSLGRLERKGITYHLSGLPPWNSTIDRGLVGSEMLRTRAGKIEGGILPRFQLDWFEPKFRERMFESKSVKTHRAPVPS